MAIPLNAAVRAIGDDARLGKVVKGPRRASRGMLWVLWEDKTSPVLWGRLNLVYVARHYWAAVSARTADAAPLNLNS